MSPTITNLPDGKVQLQTSRLLLRAAVEQDAAGLHEVFKSPEAMTYWSEPPHPNLSRTTEWLAGMLASPQNGVTDFVICLHEHDGSHERQQNPIGKIGVWSSDEIGFILHRSHWRRGLMREALTAILTYFFNERSLESVSADVDPRNEGCLALLKGVGFEEERLERGTWKVGEVWVDSLYLRVRKERSMKEGIGGEMDD